MKERRHDVLPSPDVKKDFTHASSPALRSDLYFEFWVWKQAAAPAGKISRCHCKQADPPSRKSNVCSEQNRTKWEWTCHKQTFRNDLRRVGHLCRIVNKILYILLCFCILFEGFFHPSPDRRRNVVQADGGPIAGKRSAVVVPCPPLPSTPPSSTINHTPPHQNTLQPDSKGKQSKPNSVPASPSSPQHAPEEKDIQQRETQPVVLSITDEPATPERSLSLTSMCSHGSLSDLSRPPSSLFSRSTDLASGRSSVLSGKSLALVSFTCS